MLDQQRQLPDDPRALYHRPVNRFVADYIGSANFQEVRRAERQWHLAAGGAQIRAFSRLEQPPGSPATLTFAADDCRLVDDTAASPNRNPATDHPHQSPILETLP